MHKLPILLPLLSLWAQVLSENLEDFRILRVFTVELTGLVGESGIVFKDGSTEYLGGEVGIGLSGASNEYCPTHSMFKSGSTSITSTDVGCTVIWSTVNDLKKSEIGELSRGWSQCRSGVERCLIGSVEVEAKWAFKVLLR